MERRHILIACFISAFHLIHCACPPKMWSPPDCDRPCECEWANTLNCVPLTAQCVCKSGFTGPECSDIEDCINYDTLCSDREFCENTKGSFSCKCLPGFLRSSITNICEPCAYLNKGDTCIKTCNCYSENTLLCDQVQAKCVCSLGWEGLSCEVNVDDCVGVKCASGTCQDDHNGYVCKCEKGQRMVNGQCMEYRTHFIASNMNPDVGEIFEVYILFHLPPLYHARVRLGPDFESTLVGDESFLGGECSVSLHKHKQRVYGDEAFFDLFDEKQPRLIEYHFYSSYKVRFISEGKKTLTIRPYSGTTNQLMLNFNVQYKTKSVEDCFVNMTINGTSPYPEKNIDWANQIPRQDYHTLTAVFNDSGLCKDTPHFRWTYQQVSGRLYYKKSSGNCRRRKFFKPIDMINLLRENGQPDYSDHMSQTEVVPRNTLPLSGPSRYLVCVSAYIRNDAKSSATACGFFRVRPSKSLLGTIVPYRSMFSVSQSTRMIMLQSYFWDPDKPSADIAYKWECQMKVPSQPGSNHCTFLSNSDTKRTMAAVVIPEWKQGYFKVTGTVSGARIDANVQVNLNTDINLDIMCVANGCWSDVQTWKEISFRAVTISSFNRPIVWTLAPVSKKNFQTMINGSLNSHSVTIKKNQLKPDSFYVIAVSVQGSVATAQISFKTAKLPSRGSCHLKPTTGTLVTGGFKFECTGYRDAKIGHPLMYRLLQNDLVGVDSGRDVLIGYTSTGLIPDLTLSQFVQGPVSGGQTVTVQLSWEVINEGNYVMSSNSTCQMTLSNSLDLSDLFDPKMDKHRRGNSQENLRRHKDIATVINMEWTRNITQMQFSFIRHQLLENMNNHDGRSMTLNTVRLKSFVMQTILDKDEEIIGIGLVHGIDTVTDLVGYIDQFSSEQDAYKDVFKSLLHCLDRLLTVVHDMALYHHDDSKRLAKNKEQSVRLTNAMAHMGGSLVSVMIQHNYQNRIESSRNVLIHATMVENLDSTTVNASGVSFSLNEVDLDVNEREYLLFQLYNNTPYAWAADTVFGNLPLVDVRLLRLFMLSDGETMTLAEKSRFSTPGRVAFSTKALIRESRTINADFVVSALTKTIIMSSCVTMTVTPSSRENTVLEVKSSDGLTLTVHATLATSADSLDGLSDEDMMDFPTGLNKTDLLFLPRISERRILRDYERYHVRLSIKKHQSIGRAQLQRKPYNDTLRELYTTELVVTAYSVNCVYFGQYTSHEHKNCRLTTDSRVDSLECACVVAGGYTVSVRMNHSLLNILGTDDVQEDVNLDFVNPLVSFMVAGVWITVLVSLFWARRKDRLDKLENTATILEDNEESDKHVYLVCISTGTSMTSAPSADVFVYFRGTNTSTRPQVFWDRYKVTFQPGSDDWFIMTTSHDIGDVTSAVVWIVKTDGGKDQPWHLVAVYIKNMLTKKAWVCRYKDLLNMSGERLNIVEIPATKESEMLKDQRSQLISKWRLDLRNQHLWFGLIGKTTYDKYSRVCRLVTALSVIQSLMLLNLVYFNRYGLLHTPLHTKEQLSQVHVGICILIGLQSSAISTLIGMGVSLLFKRIKPRHNMDDDTGTNPLPSQPTKDISLPLSREVSVPLDKKQIAFKSRMHPPPSTVDLDTDFSSAQSANDPSPHLPNDKDVHSLVEAMDENNKYATGKSDVNSDSKNQHDVSQNAAEGTEEGEKPKSSEKKENSDDEDEWKDPFPLDDENTSEKSKTAEDETAKPVSGNMFSRGFGRLFGTDMDTASQSQKTSTTDGQDDITPKPEKRSGSRGGLLRFFSAGIEGDGQSPALDEQKTEETFPVLGAKKVSTADGRTHHILDVLNAPHPRLARLRSEMQLKWATMVNQRTTHTPTDTAHIETEPFSLSWWCIIFMWPLVLAFNMFLSYYIVLNGSFVSFNLSLDWLLTFLIGLLANILVYQPLVIIAVAYFLVKILGKTYPYHTTGPLQRLKEAKTLLKSHWRTSIFQPHQDRRQSIRGIMQIRGSQSVAKDILRRLRLEGDARTILWDLIGYSLFLLSALYVINDQMKISPRFWISDNLKRNLLKTLKHDQGMNVSVIWDFILGTVVPVLKPTMSDSIQIESTYLMGTARLRQVRIMKNQGLCADIMERLVSYYSGFLCTQSVAQGTEETRLFNHSWDRPVAKTAISDWDSPFIYWSAEQLDHEYNHIGLHGQYSAGGYINLITPDDPVSVVGVLSKLRTTGWIDQFTRCLFVEFTLYNANLNMITGVRIAFEFVNYGAIYATVNFQSSQFKTLTSGMFVIAAFVMFACVIYYTYAALIKIKALGFRYFYHLWNLMEITILILSFTGAALMFQLKQKQLELSKTYRMHGNSRYTDFSALFDLEEKLQHILGCLGAAIILKNLKLISFSPFLVKFNKTIEISAPNLAGYLLMTMIYTVAFSCTGRILFGTLMMEYSTVPYSMFAHVRFVLGGPDLRAMFAADWVLGKIFSMLALGITQYIIINVFISILRESFGLARQMTYRDKVATLIYVKNIALGFLGISSKAVQ